MPLSTAARGYLALLVFAAGGLLAWWLRAWHGPPPAAWGLIPLLLALAVAARHFPLLLAPRYRVDASIAIYFAGLLLLGPPAAMALAGVAQLLGDLTLGKRRGTARSAAFNAGQMALAVGSAGLIYYGPRPYSPPAAFPTRADLWLLPAAGATLHLVNSGAVALMAGLQLGRRPLALWRAGQREQLPEAAGLLSLGLAAALLAARHPWAPLLLVSPATFLHLALRRTTELLERQRADAARLAHQATHDPLTGLPNRRLFRDRLDRALTRPATAERSLAVLFLDLDDFKVVNDSLGHATGDELLVAVAARLAGALRPGDTAARFGGDEFALLLADVAGADEAVAVAERLGARVREPLALASRAMIVAVSIGIALGLGDADGDELLRRADLALYRAKEAGKGRHALFEPAMMARAARRLALELELRRALARAEFVVHYQPMVIAATGRIAGVEALARWAHPERGLVPPGEFIPLAEETGLIGPLGAWVLAEACRQAAWWHARYPADPPLLLSVNLSVRQFRDPGLAAGVARALAAAGLPAEALALEITESMVAADVDTALTVLRALKALGVRLAIDDFGTGYSSLRALQRFPIDVLKVDKSFVDGLERDARSRGIAAAVFALGQTLGLQVVAEGVETAGQLAQVRALGGGVVQGYYYAGPLPPAALGPLLARGILDGHPGASGVEYTVPPAVLPPGRGSGAAGESGVVAPPPPW